MSKDELEEVLKYTTMHKTAFIVPTNDSEEYESIPLITKEEYDKKMKEFIELDKEITTLITNKEFDKVKEKADELDECSNLIHKFNTEGPLKEVESKEE